MVDSRFFPHSAPKHLWEIATITGARLDRDDTVEEHQPRIGGASSFLSALPDEISYWLGSRSTTARPVDASFSQCGACLVRPDTELPPCQPSCRFLYTDNPRSAWVKLIKAWYQVDLVAEAPRSSATRPRYGPACHIDPGAHLGSAIVLGAGVVVMAGSVIADQVMVGAATHIGAGAVISPKASIGRNCRIGVNSYIGPDAVLGDDVHIGACSSLSHCRIGHNVRISAGARIGEVGFGVVADEDGLAVVPQIGRVIIHDGVVIGANTTIDRGALNDTVVGPSAMFDNLVHVAHNVIVYERVLLTGQVGISGSVVLERDAVLGGNSGVADHVRIGAGARIAAKSGIMANVAPGSTIFGIPGQEKMRYFRQLAFIKRAAQRKLP